jgi:hypothetical protein
MRKSPVFSGVCFGLLLPVSSLVGCATSPADGAGDDAELEQGAPSRTGGQDPGAISVQAADDALLAQTQFSAPVYNGNGCPQGTGNVTLSADHRTLTVDAPAAFRATTAGSIVDRRRFCQTSVSVAPPAGVRLGIAQISFAGSATISGTGAGDVTLEKRFPFGADDVTNIDVTKSGALALDTNAGVTWSGCGESTIAIASVALLTSGASAELKGTRFTTRFVAERCQ